MSARGLPLSLLLLGGCLAHFPRHDEPLEFMERTYVGVPIDAGQIFEAQPALHILLWNGLDDPAVWRSGGTRLTLSFGFLATIRMYDTASDPVQLPTYNPRLKLQILRLSAPGAEGDGSAPRWLAGLEVVAAHESNGQKGCALADHQRATGASDFSCTPTGTPPSTALNLVDGSFSRNFLGLAARAKWLFPSEAGGVPRLAVSGAGGVEWDPRCTFAGCIETPMKARYGEAIVRGSVELDRLVVRDVHRSIPGLGVFGFDARLRATASGSIHLGLGGGRAPFGDFAAEVAYVPRYRRGLGVGPFVRWHRGRDYLNIRFEERLDVWTVGVVLDPLLAEPMPAGEGDAGRAAADSELQRAAPSAK